MADGKIPREVLELEAIRLRREDREEALLNLVEVALLYNDEMQRDDPAHMGRLTKRRKTLEEAIDAVHELIHPGPITDDVLEYTRRMLKAEERARRQHG